jgi:hypothetical protein
MHLSLCILVQRDFFDASIVQCSVLAVPSKGELAYTSTNKWFLPVPVAVHPEVHLYWFRAVLSGENPFLLFFLLFCAHHLQAHCVSVHLIALVVLRLPPSHLARIHATVHTGACWCCRRTH